MWIAPIYQHSSASLVFLVFTLVFINVYIYIYVYAYIYRERDI